MDVLRNVIRPFCLNVSDIVNLPSERKFTGDRRRLEDVWLLMSFPICWYPLATDKANAFLMQIHSLNCMFITDKLYAAVITYEVQLVASSLPV